MDKGRTGRGRSYNFMPNTTKVTVLFKVAQKDLKSIDIFWFGRNLSAEAE